MHRRFWLHTLNLSHRERSQVVRTWRTYGRRVHPGTRRPRRLDPIVIERDCKTQHIHILTPEDDAYPEPLFALHDPPAVLFARGDVELLGARRRVGVVGARAASDLGRRVAIDLGRALARAGIAVVSGLAEGIDGWAHEGCLDREGQAIGVLGTGVQRVYPRHHRTLHQQVLTHGCLVSELPPHAGPRGHQFLARNRILAALAPTLVVVEAGERSGALSTADFALQLGNEVCAVPGAVDHPNAVGTNRLLREGATLIRHGRDLLDSLGLVAPDHEDNAFVGALTAEEIARRRGWSVAQVNVALTEWELEGRVRRVEGGRFEVIPRK